MPQPGLTTFRASLFSSLPEHRSTLFRSFAALLLLLLTIPAAQARTGRPPDYIITATGAPSITEDGGSIMAVQFELSGHGCAFSGNDWTTSAAGTGANPAEPGDIGGVLPTMVGFSDTGLLVGVNVAILNDADFDDETVTLTLTAAGGNVICSGTQNPSSTTYSHTFTIIDDEVPPPTVRISSSLGVGVTEGNAGTTAVPVTVELLNAPSPEAYSLQVQVATQDMSATSASGDFQGTLQSVFFSDTSPGPKVVNVLVNGDTIPEPNEGFAIKLVNPGVGVVIHADHVVNVTINNDDGPLPEVSVLDLSWPEGSGGGSGNATITLQVANAPIGTPMNVDWFTDNLGAVNPATPNVDYQTSSGTLNFVPNVAFYITQILVPVVADDVPETNETFFVKLNSTDIGTIIDSSAVVTIEDDDAAPLPTVEIEDNAPGSVVEGNVNGTVTMGFTITLTGPAPAPGTTVKYRTLPGTAQAGSDYLNTTGTLNFSSPNPLVQVIQIPIVSDTTAESLEDFVVELYDPVGMTITTPKAKAQIVDDDSAAPPPNLSVAGVTLDEGDAGQTAANFTVTLDAPSDAPVTFSWVTADETATVADGDYVQRISGNGFIAAGQTTLTLPVQVKGDNRVEPDETFAVVIGDLVGAVATNTRASSTIRNDDTEGEFSFSISDVSIAEGNAGVTAATFTVTLSSSRGVVPTVDYSANSGTATLGADFQSSSGQLVFSEGATSKTITVNIVGDTLVEGDETFTVKLEDPTGGATLADDTGVGTIVDDDAITPELPILTIDDVVVLEGNSGTTTATFTARISVATAIPITADFTTVDGTATVADNDYQARSGQITFTGGATQTTVAIEVVGDTRVEADEIFSVQLANPQGAQLGRALGRAQVRNDDVEAPPQSRSRIRISRVESVSENAPFAAVFVERVGEGAGQASARVNAFAGTATAGEDFTPISEEISWGNGVTGEIEVRVPLIGDNRVESDETLRIAVTNVTGAEEGTPLEADLRLLDDDAPMRLEIVGSAELDVQVGNEVALTVKTVRSDGVPVAGALIAFEAVTGPVRLLGDGEVRSNAEGLATQRVALGPAPGLARVRALLRGKEAEASFLLKVAGNLGQVGGGGGGGDRTVGGALDESCAEATGELAEACAFLYGLGNPEDQRRALAELTPQGVAAQVRAALQAPKNQNRNVGSRLDALRGGGPIQTLDQLALSIQGQNLGGIGTLQQSLLRGAVGSASPNLASTSGTPVHPDLPLGGSEAERIAKNDAVKLDFALAKARYGDKALAKEGDATALDPYDSTESPWGAFVNGRLSFGDAPQRGEDPGYDFETEGMTAGVDYRLSNEFVVGLAVGFVATKSELDVDGGSIDTDGWSLNLYGTWYRDNWYAEAVLGYGRNDYEFKRVILLPRPFQGQDQITTLGTPKSDQLSADLGAGYDFRLTEALSLTGFGRLSYIDTSIDEYSERGGGPFSLAFAGQDMKSLLAEAGAELTYPISLSWGVLQPLVRVSYLHEFEDDPQVVRARFLGDPGRRFFVLRSERPDRNYLNLAAGLSATLPRGWATFLQYDTDLQREELDIYTLSGGLRFQF